MNGVLWGVAGFLAAGLLAYGVVLLAGALCDALWRAGVIAARALRWRQRARRQVTARATRPLELGGLVVYPALEEYRGWRWGQAAPTRADLPVASDGIGDDAVTLTCTPCGSDGIGRCTCAYPCGRSWCGAGWAA